MSNVTFKGKMEATVTLKKITFPVTDVTKVQEKIKALEAIGNIEGLKVAVGLIEEVAPVKGKTTKEKKPTRTRKPRKPKETEPVKEPETDTNASNTPMKEEEKPDALPGLPTMPKEGSKVEETTPVEEKPKGGGLFGNLKS